MISNLLETIFFNPIKIAELSLRREIREAIKWAAISNLARCLDVGCGMRPYERDFPPGSYFGIDVEASGRAQELKAPDYYYDGTVLPFSDHTYECVLCTQVLEHVSHPQQILSEMYRVLKPGGSNYFVAICLGGARSAL